MHGDSARMSRYSAKKLVAQERGRAHEAKLRIKFFFSESDAMIGKVGQRYMEACWDHAREFGDVLEYSSATVEGANHDTILTTAAVLEEVIADVAGIDVGHGVGHGSMTE